MLSGYICCLIFRCACCYCVLQSMFAMKYVFFISWHKSWFWKYKIIAKSKKTNVLPWVVVMAFFLYHLIFFVVVTIWSLHNKTNFFFICFLSSMSEVLGTNVYLSCYFFFEYTETLVALLFRYDEYMFLFNVKIHTCTFQYCLTRNRCL